MMVYFSMFNNHNFSENISSSFNFTL